MSQVHLAFLWHQHQPYYPDDVAGELLMPWVRLHGVKDYWGMAMHLDEFPEVRCTINLVPSLLAQIAAYTDGGMEDKLLRVSRVPAEDLSHADLLYLLDNGFMANLDRLIRPHPRYFELWRSRGFGADTAEQAAKRFRPRDTRDLQVWANLAWVHPIAMEKDGRLAELVEKRRGYTEEEKQWLLNRQIELLREIVPLHRRLMERGQLELTTTPFYHPILPLLWDKSLAREAMPDTPLPRHRESYPDDAAWQIDAALAFHERTFGARPRGMWPSEGSVCQPIIPKLAETGIRWIATDEEILFRSLDGRVGRDSRGFVRHPELLYRGWRAVQGDQSVNIVFRDHALSDLIGFEYQRSDAHAAAHDFIARISAIGRATEHARPTLVNVILDGENCWEYYHQLGVPFLRTLYQQLSRTPHIRTTRIGEYLDEHPPRDTLHRLFAGSWINHNFYIWIGHDDDRRAWDLLHETREHLKRAAAQGRIAADKLDAAWRELHIAEGSDWFWWFGDDHSSAQDALFDYLFRKHLQNVYTLLGDSPPPQLLEPIGRAAARKLHTDPRDYLKVQVDGRFSYFEWLNAGRYVAGSERSTMARVTRGTISELHFGFSTTDLLLRVDTQGPARGVFHEMDAFHVTFLRPSGYQVIVSDLATDQPRAVLSREGNPLADATLRVAVDRILEVAVPLDRIGVQLDQPVSFFLEVHSGGRSIERVPVEGNIDTRVPPADFARINWQA